MKLFENYKLDEETEKLLLDMLFYPANASVARFPEAKRTGRQRSYLTKRPSNQLEMIFRRRLLNATSNAH